MGSTERIMDAEVSESIGKFGLVLAVAGGLVNSALPNLLPTLIDFREYRTSW